MLVVLMSVTEYQIACRALKSACTTENVKGSARISNLSICCSTFKHLTFCFNHPYLTHPFCLSFQPDRQYTVYLNITNEDYKEGLRDPESLEFLNFAQAVRAAVSFSDLSCILFYFLRIRRFSELFEIFNQATEL